jgi:hypothetical protein
MSPSARRSRAPLFLSFPRAHAKTCPAALDWADEDICPYALWVCAKLAKFFYLSCSKAVILILLKRFPDDN